MKLIYLSESRIPSRQANAVHVMKMCAAYGALGHEVTLVTPAADPGTETGVDSLFAFYGVARNFEIRRLARPPIKGRAWIYGWRAGRLAARERPDAALGRSLHACAVAARSGVPTAWDAHMATFLQVPHERWLFGNMVTARMFGGLTTNCEALRRAIVAEFPALASRTVAAHNGADPLPDDLTPADLGGSMGRLQVGYVGQLYPGKGMEIIRGLAGSAHWADFHVVGGSEGAVAALKHEAALPANVRVHGFVPPGQTGRYCLAFDVLLAPYQGRVEVAGGGETSAWMSPIKLFEYMAAGKPILVSDLPVLREIVHDGRNAITLPPDDVGAWTAALRRLADDPAERERLGADARADFLARHTWLQRARVVLAKLDRGR